MQASLSQFTPGSSGRHPLSYWIDYIEGLPPLPGARMDPLVEIPSVGYKGFERLSIDFFCDSEPPADYDFLTGLGIRHGTYHESYFPEIMRPLYSLAHDLIQDDFIIEQWRIPCVCCGGHVDPVLRICRRTDGGGTTHRYYLPHSHHYNYDYGTYVPIMCSEGWA